MSDLPEGYRAREGDELLVRVRVRFDMDDGDKTIFVEPVSENNRHTRFAVNLADVEALYLRHWQEGDRVRKRNGQIGEIAAACGEYVWVKGPAGPPDTVHANDLDPDVPDEAAADASDDDEPAAYETGVVRPASLRGQDDN